MLAENLRRLGLHDLAIVWLLDLFALIQEIDDVADKDPCDHVALVTKALVDIPQNPWYQANIQRLAPVVATQVFKWLAANNLEKSKEEPAKAYMWRAGFYDVVLFVASLHGPVDHPELIAKLYGETYEDYLKEVYHA